MSIKEQHDYYKSRERHWQAKLSALRERCTHENVNAKYKANTGNWCVQDDLYWVEVDCQDCGEHFSVHKQDDINGYHYWGARVHKC